MLDLTERAAVDRAQLVDEPSRADRAHLLALEVARLIQARPPGLDLDPRRVVAASGADRADDHETVTVRRVVGDHQRWSVERSLMADGLTEVEQPDLPPQWVLRQRPRRLASSDPRAPAPCARPQPRMDPPRRRPRLWCSPARTATARTRGARWQRPAQPSASCAHRSR